MRGQARRDPPLAVRSVPPEEASGAVFGDPALTSIVHAFDRYSIDRLVDADTGRALGHLLEAFHPRWGPFEQQRAIATLFGDLRSLVDRAPRARLVFLRRDPGPWELADLLEHVTRARRLVGLLVDVGTGILHQAPDGRGYVFVNTAHDRCLPSIDHYELAPPLRPRALVRAVSSPDSGRPLTVFWRGRYLVIVDERGTVRAECGQGRCTCYDATQGMLCSHQQLRAALAAGL